MQRTEAKARGDVADMRQRVVIRQMQHSYSFSSTNCMGHQKMSNPWISDKMYGAELMLSDEAATAKYPATATAKNVAACAGYRHPRALDGDLNRYVTRQREQVTHNPPTIVFEPICTCRCLGVSDISMCSQP